MFGDGKLNNKGGADLMIIFDLKGIKAGKKAQNNDCDKFHCKTQVLISYNYPINSNLLSSLLHYQMPVIL